jgi:hypothetical protein
MYAAGTGRIQQWHTIGHAGPPIASDGSFGSGEQIRDINYALWICTAGGNPGTWARVGTYTGAGGAISFLTAPVRILDASSHNSGLINRSPLSGNEVFQFQVAGLGSSGIPVSALGLVCNLTVLNAGANGNLSMFPADVTPPTSASITFFKNGYIANHVTSGLSISTANGATGPGYVKIQNQSTGSTPVVVDAVGYTL